MFSFQPKRCLNYSWLVSLWLKAEIQHSNIVQHENFFKINKRAGWNKSVQDGKFQKINKICCTIIRETKVSGSQYAERILNKIVNPFNKTYTG